MHWPHCPNSKTFTYGLGLDIDKKKNVLIYFENFSLQFFFTDLNERLEVTKVYKKKKKNQILLIIKNCFVKFYDFQF